MPSRTRSFWIGCLLAVATTVAVILLRTALESWLHRDAPLLIFVATTTVAAWYGGLWPGLLATALSAAAGAFYFAQPTDSLWVDESSERLWLAMIVVVGVMISLVCEALHVARRRAERSAEEALESQQRLQEADRRKNDLLALIAHELRNPLAAINTAVTVMQMNDLRGDALEECRDLISRQTAHVVRIVDDLMDISRVSRGKLKLRTEPMDLSDAVHRAVESCVPRIQSEEHELDVRVPDAPVWVEGDSDRLTQVVANLLNNAAKYTPPGGAIAVTLATQQDEAVVRVRDNGVGIPPERLGGIFNLYDQVEGSRGRSDGGLGIGLSLVRQLVEMHGGTVEAFSDGPGQGSEFVVRLRVVPPHGSAAVTRRVAQAGVP